jgi:hypothetical protein
LPAGRDERALFEAWYDAFEFRKDYDKYGPSEAAFTVWQASAALTQRAAPQASTRIAPTRITFAHEVDGPWRLGLNGVTISRHETRDGLDQAIKDLRAALASMAAPEAPAVTKAEIHTLRRLIECAGKLDERPRPMCRDCGDENGTCPNSGLECDMRKLLSNAKALHNKLASPVAAPEAPTGGFLEKFATERYGKPVASGASPVATTASASGEKTYTRAEVQQWRNDIAHAAADMVERAAPSFGDGDWSWLINDIRSLASTPAPSHKAAPQIKTWRERCIEAADAPIAGHHCRAYSEARDAEIADLRAALAQQGAAQGSTTGKGEQRGK